MALVVPEIGEAQESVDATSEDGRPSAMEISFPADRVIMHPDNRRVIVLSTSQSRVAVVDLEERLELVKIEFEERFHDVAISEDGKFLYAVGNDAKSIFGVILRINVKNLKDAKARLKDFLLSPSIGLDRSGNILIGDRLSSVVFSLPIEDIFSDARHSGYASIDPTASIFVGNHGVSRLKVSGEGPLLFVSEDVRSVVGIYELGKGELIHQIGDRRAKSSSPMQIDVVPMRETSDDGKMIPLMYIRKIPIREGVEFELVALDLEMGADKFVSRSIEVPVELLDFDELGFQHHPDLAAGPPVLLASDREQRVIVVGTRFGKKMMVYSRVGNALERRNLLELDRRPSDFDVSSDGTIVVISYPDTNKISILEDPTEWVADTQAFEGQKDIRKAQRVLALAGYDVGVIDGFSGPRTNDAVQAFGRDTGVEVSSKIDVETARAILRWAGEIEDATSFSPGHEQAALEANPEATSCEPAEKEAQCIYLGKFPDIIYPTYKPIDLTTDRYLRVVCLSQNRNAILPIQIDQYDVVEDLQYKCSLKANCEYLRRKFPGEDLSVCD